jgi:D-glycero-alpha-D-manno-heptose-7-phosphate kinase
VAYSRIELCQDAKEILHPTVREALRYLNIDKDVEIHYDGDLPGRSGMGSSSAFTVGLLNALYSYTGEIVSPRKLADDSIHIEQTMVGEQVGSQDQVSAAYGGFNRIQFSPDGEIVVRSIPVDQGRIESLNNCLMLFYTGIKRTAAEVAATYVEQIASRKNQLRKMYSMVEDAINILGASDDLDDFGSLLHETWMEKRSLSPAVSNSFIDEIYKSARSAGALGGKLAGAGGGGMLLFYAPIEKQAMIREKLSSLIHVPFRFEMTGSQIIFQDKRQRYTDGERWREKNKTEFFEAKGI